MRGTIPQVEMTSLGFAKSLNPYEITPAEIACVQTGGCFSTEKDVFTRVMTGIRTGCVIGYKYFDFGTDHSMSEMSVFFRIAGAGVRAEIHVLLDGEDGEEIGVCQTDTHDGVYKAKLRPVDGRHSVYFRIEHTCREWSSGMFDQRNLFDLEAFVFTK
jgi:hypothetical protein